MSGHPDVSDRAERPVCGQAWAHKQRRVPAPRACRPPASSHDGPSPHGGCEQHARARQPEGRRRGCGAAADCPQSLVRGEHKGVLRYQTTQPVVGVAGRQLQQQARSQGEAEAEGGGAGRGEAFTACIRRREVPRTGGASDGRVLAGWLAERAGAGGVLAVCLAMAMAGLAMPEDGACRTGIEVWQHMHMPRLGWRCEPSRPSPSPPFGGCRLLTRHCEAAVPHTPTRPRALPQHA